MLKSKRKISSEAAKDAGLALVLAGMLLYHFFQLKFLFFFALIMLLLTMTCPAVFKVWARVWFGFSDLLGKCVSVVVIGIAFFFVVTPIGLIRRALGKDSLMLRHWKNGSGSVMIERNHLFCKKDIERPF